MRTVEMFSGDAVERKLDGTRGEREREETFCLFYDGVFFCQKRKEKQSGVAAGVGVCVVWSSCVCA